MAGSMDRSGDGRDVLHAALYTAPTAQRLVEDQFDKAEQLIASGRMQPAGLREVEAAKADGRWDAAYEGSARMDVPGECPKPSGEAPRRAASSTSSIGSTAIRSAGADTAKKPETRKAKAEKFVAMMERGEKIHG